ncbi:MAG TPA: cupin domain-containing protein, partial [Conexibacter sp.]
MQITRSAAARPYATRGHHEMVALQLQGEAATDTETVTVGLSHFLPGGGASLSHSPRERVYVVVAGEMTVVAGGEEATLAA